MSSRLEVSHESGPGFSAHSVRTVPCSAPPEQKTGQCQKARQGKDQIPGFGLVEEQEDLVHVLVQIIGAQPPHADPQDGADAYNDLSVALLEQQSVDSSETAGALPPHDIIH